MGILYIGNQLRKHGFNPTTIDTLSVKLMEISSIVCASDKRNEFLRMLDMLLAIWRNRRRAGVVLIDTYSTRAFYYAVLSIFLCIALRKRYVPILHGGDLPSRLQSDKWLCSVVFGRSLANISPSIYLKRAFENAGYEVRHIPNFISISEYPFLKREVVRPRLLYVRSFHAIYNPELAVHILSELSESYANSSLCMVGPDKDGSLARVKKIAQSYGLLDRIEFTGSLEKEAWIKHAANFDIFINTTNVDNMPVSVVEAMALGMVVISTNVGGIPGLIDHEVNGILVKPGDKRGFVSWISRLIDDPAMAERLSSSAREKAHSFDWNVVGSQWRSLLENEAREIS